MIGLKRSCRFAGHRSGVALFIDRLDNGRDAAESVQSVLLNPSRPTCFGIAHLVGLQRHYKHLEPSDLAQIPVFSLTEECDY